MSVIQLQAAMAAGFFIIILLFVLVFLFVILPIPFYKLMKSVYLEKRPEEILVLWKKILFLILAYLLSAITVFVLGAVFWVMMPESFD